MDAWRSGDPRGGERLTQTYFEAIRRYFFRRAPDEYEDLMQRTFLEFARAKQGYRGEGTVRAFLFAIARHVHLQHLGAAARWGKIDTFRSSAFEILGRRPSSLIAAQREHQALIEVLEQIPVHTQDLLELYYWHELPGPEISTIMKISSNELHGQLFRARKLLRDELGQRGISRSDEQVEALLEQTRELDE